ncbi:hypothetical protein Q3G72_027807 [Acer saccharum]|nr:hypothetical protein Q3G72_027807 [Acer saccharum]
MMRKTLLHVEARQRFYEDICLTRSYLQSSMVALRGRMILSTLKVIDEIFADEVGGAAITWQVSILGWEVKRHIQKSYRLLSRKMKQFVTLGTTNYEKLFSQSIMDQARRKEFFAGATLIVIYET